MHSPSRAIVVAMSLLVAPLALSAQTTQARQGFNISFGVGAGSGGVTCDGCSTDRQNGYSGYLRMGGTVSPKLIVGGETQGWMHSSNSETDQFSYLTAFAQYYPSVSNGLFLKGGLGFGATSFEVKNDPFLGDYKMTSGGMAGTIGMGYDIRMATNFSLTPYMNYLSTFGANAKSGGQDLGFKLNGNVVQLGIGFTWH